MRSKKYAYADMLLEEWTADSDWPPRVRRYMRQVLGELQPGAQLILRNEPRLQIVVHPDHDKFSCWASFPMHKNRTEARWLKERGISVRPQCRVLLQIWNGRPDRPPLEPLGLLRDHLGHTLLYLQSPRAPNECRNAMKEWRRCCRG